MADISNVSGRNLQELHDSLEALSCKFHPRRTFHVPLLIPNSTNNDQDTALKTSISLPRESFNRFLKARYTEMTKVQTGDHGFTCTAYFLLLFRVSIEINMNKWNEHKMRNWYISAVIYRTKQTECKHVAPFPTAAGCRNTEKSGEAPVVWGPAEISGNPFRRSPAAGIARGACPTVRSWQEGQVNLRSLPESRESRILVEQ